MTLGEKLKQVREAAGLSQPGLAEAAGVPASSVRNYEQGRRMPTFPVMARFAAALGVKLDEFAACSDVAGDEPASKKAPAKKPAPRGGGKKKT